jgi:hypothetical protein
MKRSRISFLVLMLLIPSLTFGQAVPPALKLLAKSNLSCDDPSVYAEQIGPSKRGYVATCGDSEAAVYEKNLKSFRKLFQTSDGPMRAQWSFSKRATKGYFDFGWTVMGNSGGSCWATWRWNGHTYTKIQEKCSD